MLERLKSEAKPVVLLAILMVVIELVNAAAGRSLSQWGIKPREITGLIGIPFAPLLHAGFTHLASNVLPLLVLGTLTRVGCNRSFTGVTTIIVVGGGLGTWAIGKHGVHVGASGLVFGYFGFAVARAWIDRTVWAAIAAVATLFLYSGLIWGVLPNRPWVSWEGHLCGLLAGVLAARLLPNRPDATDGAAAGEPISG